MSTRQLIDAIASGDAVEIQTAFDASISARIVDRLDAMRQDVAQNMFKEAAEELDELSADTLKSYQQKRGSQLSSFKYGSGKQDMTGREQKNAVVGINKSKTKLAKEDVEDLEEADAKVHPDALHVQHVGGGKYKVHAVGKNFADGIKAGEHVSDSELDDFREMGGKVKNVK